MTGQLTEISHVVRSAFERGGATVTDKQSQPSLMLDPQPTSAPLVTNVEPGPAPAAAVTPLGAVSRGLLAGAAGTLAMDLLWFYRYKRDDGEDGFRAWEFSSGLCSWEQAPAPAQLGKRFIQGVFEYELPPERAPLVNNLTHWGYGMLAGTGYAIVAGTSANQRIWYGAAFGATVWATSYVVLPMAKLYKPIWEYDRSTLARDLSAHLVYGLTTATSFRRLSRRWRGKE